MGKAVLLIVLGTTLAASAMYLSRDEALLDQKLAESRYEGEVLAREAATSAFNLVVGNVKSDFSGYRESLSGMTYRDAQYDISATDGADDDVVITATGKYDGFAYRITGSVERGGQRLLDALTIDGAVTNPDFRGSYSVTGVDYKLDGSRAVGPDVRGILVTNSSSFTSIQAEASRTQVTGLEGTLDVVYDNPHTSLDELESAIRNYSGSALVVESGNTTFSSGTLGSLKSPKVVRVSGNATLAGNFVGYGILYASGNITFEGNANWNGIVFGNHAEGGLHSFSNDSAVFGSVVLRSAAEESLDKDEEDEEDDSVECDDDKSAKSKKSKKSKKSAKSKKSCKSDKSKKSKKSDKSKKSKKSKKSAPDGLVYVCHIPPGNPGNSHTLSIDAAALAAHLAHGDTEGACQGDTGETEPGDAFRIILQDRATIRYSSEAIRPLKNLLEQVDVGEEAVHIKRKSEGAVK